MVYAIPDPEGGWRRLRWPAPKISSGWLVRPGSQGVTQALLDAVGAVGIVDDGPNPPAGQTVDTRTLEDVDGTPTVVYTYRDLTAEEIAAAADNADRQTKLVNVGNAVTVLRQWADDAEGVTVTNGNAVATLQTVVNRLGIFFDRFADLIEAQRLDQGNEP